MDNTGLIMPLNIISRYWGDTKLERAIRANFVRIVKTRMQAVKNISALECRKLTDVIPKIEKVEPELAKSLWSFLGTVGTF